MIRLPARTTRRTCSKLVTLLGFLVVSCAPFFPDPGASPPNQDPVSQDDDTDGDDPPMPPPPPPLADVTGNRNFKLRIGVNANHSEQYIVGDRPDTDTVIIPFSVRRFRGDQPLPVNLSYEILDGDFDDWIIVVPTESVTLGPAPAVSTADYDRDGDVDSDDMAQFQACLSGDGTIYPLGIGCQVFDFDNDLDVDEADEAAFQQAFTGPVTTPWRHDLELAVTAKADTPQGAALRLRTTGTNLETGESNPVYAHVTKRSFGVSIDVMNRVDLTTERSAKLTTGGEVGFDLSVMVTGANPEVIRLVPGQITDPPGFSLLTLSSTSEPLTEFTLAPAEFDRSIFRPEGFDVPAEWPPPGRGLRLAVTLPDDFPVRARQTVSLQAQDLLGGQTAQVDLLITKVPAIWTPSDLFEPEGRRHLVRPGKPTTFILLVTNVFSEPKTFTLIPTRVAPSPLWKLELSAYALPLDPGQQIEVVATLTAPPNVLIGQTADWNVTLTDSADFANITRLGAEVTDMHKVIFIGIDGLQPEYMYLNAAGTGPGAPDDWLMPNVQKYIADAANYLNAKCSLPAITDTNHVNALCGTRTGTAGVPSVFYYYFGEDDEGSAVTVKGDASLLRYGPHGTEILTAFDVAKLANPRAFTAIATGKNWIASFFVKEQGGVDLIVNGRGWPHYVRPPEAYVLGDPPTDPDADDDPPGKSDFANWGQAAGLFPDDRWVLEGAIRVIANQDPDVFYILLAHTDDIQHQIGAAWNPDEWDDRGTESTWDDVNRINPLATREDVLDVIREADHLVGDLIEFLRQRGTLDETYIVLTADHGFMTQTPGTVDLRILLEEYGYSFKDDFEAFGGNGVALLLGVAPEDELAVETILETGRSITPGMQQNPWVVMSRSEMVTGIDLFTNIRLAVPGELYSEFYVEHELDLPDQQRWPSFYLFFTGPWQTTPMFVQAGEDAAWDRLFVGGHAGPDTQHIPLVIFGPDLPRGAVFTEEVSIADIAPTLYHLQGWPVPDNVDGSVLPGISAEQ